MKSVGVISKPNKPELAEIIPKMMAWLRAAKVNAVLDRESGKYADRAHIVDRADIAAEKPELVIVLGGDGTLLAAARVVAKAGIPILSVNLGSLGFLTEIPHSQLLDTLEGWKRGRCTVERRTMLHCKLIREGKSISEFDALNDVVASKGTIARMADFNITLNGVFVSSYRADALIVSTPTGSTAYSLAAGGPVLAPNVQGFVITPVSPHALTNRPLVVQSSAEIRIHVQGIPENAFLTVDGQEGVPLADRDEILCLKSQHEVQLVRMNGPTFFEVLRRKLKWGER